MVDTVEDTEGSANSVVTDNVVVVVMGVEEIVVGISFGLAEKYRCGEQQTALAEWIRSDPFCLCVVLSFFLRLGLSILRIVKATPKVFCQNVKRNRLQN